MSEIAEVVLTIAASAASGGLLGAGFTAYAQNKKLPAEIDHITVSGAEKAVTTLVASLAAETARADRAEAAVEERDCRIEALEAKIDILYAALDAVRDELHAIKAANQLHP